MRIYNYVFLSLSQFDEPSTRAVFDNLINMSLWL